MMHRENPGCRWCIVLPRSASLHRKLNRKIIMPYTIVFTTFVAYDRMSYRRILYCIILSHAIAHCRMPLHAVAHHLTALLHCR